MDNKCKLCGKSLSFQYYVVDSNHCRYRCNLCPEYYVYNRDMDFNQIVAEWLLVKNIFFHFCHEKKIVTIRFLNETDMYSAPSKEISFSLNELTHELAVQWVKKLKTYAVFQ